MSDVFSFRRREFLLGGLAGAAGLALPPSAGAQEPGKKVRYAVVGCGNRSRNGHLQVVKQFLPEVEVVALADITPENLHQAAEVAGPAVATYSDYRKMLAEHPEIDAVIVIVPNYLHAEIAVAALRAGKHVLVEKPMALTLRDADLMIEAAAKNKRVLQVGQQSRYNDTYHRMAELIRQGAIGDLEYVFAWLFRGDWNPRSWQYTDQATGKRTNWRFLTKTAGSALLEDGIHELDVIHWLVGARPRKIQAQGGNNVFKDRETIDNAGLLIEFANDTRCTFGYTVFTPGVPNSHSMRLLGSKAEMTAEGTRAATEIVVRPYRGQPERIAVPHVRPEESSWKSREGGSGDFDVETYRLHKSFVKSITSGAPVFTDGRVGRDAIHISLAAERSLRTGQVFSWEQEAGL